MWTVKVLVVVLLAVLGPYIYRYLNFMRYHETGVRDLHPGTCTTLPGIENGSEDMELLPSGKLMITSGARNSFEGSVRGRVLLIDLNQSELRVAEITIDSEIGFDHNTFNPAGLAKWINPDSGEMVIFITNYNPNIAKGTVERFHFSEEERTLYHLETVGKDDPNFFMVNDIAPISETEFYYTNFHGEYPQWEFIYALNWASTGFYDGQRSHITDSGLAAPNGIGISPDGKYVYVDVYSGRFMRIYERLPDNTLRHLEDHVLPMSGDNIVVEENGDLLVSGHPIGWMTMRSLTDKEAKVPSWVVHLTMKDGKVTSSRDVFIDDGTLHSLGSVALQHKGKLFLGTVNRKATICELREHS